MEDEIGAFGSPKELEALLETIGLRLHAKNRIAGGESNYLWHLAEIIRGAGRLAARFETDPELEVLYGDGYDPGTLPPEEHYSNIQSLLAAATIGRT